MQEVHTSSLFKYCLCKKTWISLFELTMARSKSGVILNWNITFEIPLPLDSPYRIYEPNHLRQANDFGDLFGLCQIQAPPSILHRKKNRRSFLHQLAS